MTDLRLFLKMILQEMLRAAMDKNNKFVYIYNSRS